MKNTRQFGFLQERSSGPNQYKPVTGVLFKIENKTIVFEKDLYNRYELTGDFLEMPTTSKFDNRKSTYGQTL